MKTAVAQILDAHPRPVSSIDSRVLAECIEACGACAQACTACADACLSEPSTADVIANVRSSLDCADICAATSRVLTRADDSRIAVAAAMLQACVAACRSCQTACGSTATESSVPFEHAAACRLACERCAESCAQLLAALPSR